MLTRRDVIKKAVISTVGIATVGVLGACTAQPNNNENNPVENDDNNTLSFDKEADVVIVGGGGAGVTAALQASSDGASVLILEKTDKHGGTTNLSGGVMQAAGTDVQKANSNYKDDTPEKHYQYWLKAGEGYLDEELVKDLAYTAPEHIQWLTNLGLKFNSIYGHNHIPYIEDDLFADRIHVYEGGGLGGTGNILVNTMLDAALAKQAVIEYNTSVTNLITNEAGVVIGVLAEQNGREIKVKAKKGVILATASVDSNPEMAKLLNPQQYWSITTQVNVCSPANTGDGIRMAMDIGASVVASGGTIDFCGKTGIATDNRIPVFPYFNVNKAGRRFVCEDATYAYTYRAIYQQEKQFDAPTYMIFGKSSLAAEGSPWTEESVEQDVASGAVLRADTIEALADLIKVEPQNLTATLSTWNSDAKAGADLQFDRKMGVQEITGPFYAYKNTAFNLGAITGVKINTDGQVIKANGSVIPRLYASGLTAGGWIGPYYPGSGTAIIGLVHWGRKAGAHAAKLDSI